MQVHYTKGHQLCYKDHIDRGVKHRVKCPEAPTESRPVDVRSELRQILPIHITLYPADQVESKLLAAPNFLAIFTLRWHAVGEPE